MGVKGIDTLGGSETERAADGESRAREARKVLLLGRDSRALDDRGRLSLPTKYRWAFDEGAVVVPWPGPCLAVMPVDRFLKIERKMRTKQRDRLGDSLARDALTELATHTMLDAQGRLFLDPGLRSDVGIGHDLIVIGRIHQLELWAPGSRDEGREERLQALHAHIAAEAL